MRVEYAGAPSKAGNGADVPVYLRGQAKLRTGTRGELPVKQRPGETRKVAERWGQILQKVVWRPSLPET